MAKPEGPQIEDEAKEIPEVSSEKKAFEVEKDPEYEKIQDQVITEMTAGGNIDDPKELAGKVIEETQRRYEAFQQNKNSSAEPAPVVEKPEEEKEPILDVGMQGIREVAEEITGKKISDMPEVEPAPIVEKPEEPPETQTQERPVNIDLDLKDAKDRLAKLYGSGTEIVGAENLGEIAKTEETTEQIKPSEPNIIDVEKSIPIPVPRKESSIAPEQPIIEESPEQKIQQIQERLKTPEEPRHQEVEASRIQLEEELRAIDMARQRKDRATELTLYRKVEALFESAEGKNLKRESVKKADAQLSEENLVRISSAQYREKFTKTAEDLIEQRKRSNILANRFALLSVEEKAKYVGKDGNIDINKFNVEMDAKITAKIEELNKKGISLPKNVFYAMMERGYKPEEIKIRGFFGRVFVGKEISIPQMPFFKKKLEAQQLDKKQFLELINMVGGGFDRTVKGEAAAMIEWEVQKGKKMWTARKQKGMREVISETVEGYKKQQEKMRQQEELEENQKRLQGEIAQRVEAEAETNPKNKRKKTIKKPLKPKSRKNKNRKVEQEK